MSVAELWAGGFNMESQLGCNPGSESVLEIHRGAGSFANPISSPQVRNIAPQHTDSTGTFAAVTRSTKLPGLHRIQTLDVSVPRLKLPVACVQLSGLEVHLGAVITLPDHAYVDMDEARALGRAFKGSGHVDSGPAVTSPEAFIDVERPTAASTQHTVATWRALRLVGLGVDAAEASHLDSTRIRRPGAEAGVAASLDPGSAWVAPVVEEGSGCGLAPAVVSLNVTLRMPIHVRYQAPGCSGESDAPPLNAGECYAPVAIPAPELFWRIVSASGGDSPPSAGEWSPVRLTHDAACSFSAVAGAEAIAYGRPTAAGGDVVDGHGGFETVPGSGLTVDRMEPVPVGATADEARVVTWTVLATAVAAATVVRFVVWAAC